MEHIPPEQALRLRGFTIAPSGRDLTEAGFALYRADGSEFYFVLTRAQLLDIIEECRKATDAMPKPS